MGPNVLNCKSSSFCFSPEVHHSNAVIFPLRRYDRHAVADDVKTVIRYTEYLIKPGSRYFFLQYLAPLSPYTVALIYYAPFFMRIKRK